LQGIGRKTLSVFFAILLLTSVVSVIQIKPAFSSHGNQTQLTFTMNPSKDSFLTQGSQSNNEGANQILRIISSDKNRPVISFDQNAINEKLVNGRTLASATLQLYVTSNGNNWGPSGKNIAAYRLLSDWQEGNGWNVGNNISGSGAGTTWACPTDSNISNNQNDCTAQWNGGSFAATASGTKLITNGLVNQWITFDVTSNVQSFIAGSSPNYGWIVKKADESQNGAVEFASKESATNLPQLVIVVNLSQGEILFNQYSDLVTELGSISQISDESVVTDYLVDSITKLKTDTQNLVTDANARQTLISILDSALQSANSAGNSVLALDEINANQKISEAKTFVGNYATQIALLGGTTIPQPDADLLISKANKISSDSLKRDIEATNLISGTPLFITSQIIDRANSAVSELRVLGSEFESLGFVMTVETRTNSPTRGFVLFSNPDNSQVFEIEIITAAMAAMSTIEIFNEASSSGLTTTKEEFVALLIPSPEIVADIAFGPAVTIRAPYLIITMCAVLAWNPPALAACLAEAGLIIGGSFLIDYILEHPEILQQFQENTVNAAEVVQNAVKKFVTPPTLIIIKKVENNFGGTATENKFTMRVTNNGQQVGDFPGKSEQEGGVVLTLTAGSYSVTEIDLPSGYIQIDTPEDDECSGTIAAGQTKTCTITNHDIAPTLKVIKRITNDNGGSLTISGVTLRINGTIVTNGTANTLNAGTYVVSEDLISGYIVTFSPDCPNGIITLAIGDNKICTITNNDNPPPFDLTALKAYYKFDETSGALINLSPSADSLGSVANGVADSTILRGIEGIINNAYQWNGINSKVRVGNSNLLFNFLHNSNALWTINVWYKLNDVDGPFTFIASDASSDSTNRGLELSLNPVADIFTLRIRNFGEVALVSSNIPVPEDINWHMLTVTYNQNAAPGNHAQFVLDGNVANKDVRDKAGTKAPPSAADTLLHFGSRQSTTSPTIFNGRMDEYSIWNRILADDEIAALYNNGAGLSFPGTQTFAVTQSSSPAGGPYFSLELNQTSANATRPSTVVLPLQVNWQEGYQSEPVTVDVIGINATSITTSVISTYNSTSYQLFDIAFDIPADVQAAGYQFLISVKEVESNDTVGASVILNVE
jgi:hypothetical protein